MRAIMEARRYLAFAPALHMRRGLEQRGLQRLFMTGYGGQAGIGAAFDDAIVGWVGDGVERNDPIRRTCRHAMVRQDHQIGRLAHRLQPRDQFADMRVHLRNGLRRFRRIRPLHMACRIDRVEIERDEAGADGVWAAQHVQHHVDALGAADLLIELRPVLRPRAPMDRTGPFLVLRGAPWHVGSGPEHGGGAHAGLFRRHPDRFDIVPPEGIVARHGEFFVRARGVFHVVGDDAVAVRPVARDDRPMIGEGLGGEGRPHRRLDSLTRQRRQIGRDPALEIIRAEAVDGYQYGNRSALLHLRGRRRALRRGDGGATAQGGKGEQGRGEGAG